MKKMAKQAKSEFDPKDYGFPEGTTAHEALAAVLQVQSEKNHVEAACKRIHNGGGAPVLLVGCKHHGDGYRSIIVPCLALAGTVNEQRTLIRAALIQALGELEEAVMRDDAAPSN